MRCDAMTTEQIRLAGEPMGWIAPIGMLLVSRQGGRTHCHEEWTHPTDLAFGLRPRPGRAA
jgi:hypothetical protein